MTEDILAVLARLALVTGLGLLVGLERERAGKDAGLRTFSLTALSGAITAQLGMPYPLFTLGFVCVVVIILNLNAIRKAGAVELTTSASLFVTALAGILAGQGMLFTPVAIIVITLMLLAWKEEMVAFTQALTRDEVHAAITLALLAFVILPGLPDQALDPWNVVAPRKLWVMVVLISAIGFANYVLLRLYGARGLAWTGFLGGLVNSTATVMEMASTAAGHPELEDYTFRGIMLAKTAMFLRNGVILAIFAPAALIVGMLPVGAMMAMTLLLAMWRAHPHGPQPTAKVALTSPFSLTAAVQFGLVFLALTVLAGAAQRLSGEKGFYAIAVFSGLVSSATSSATAAHLAQQNSITVTVAALGVILASAASAVVLVPIVWRTARGTRLGVRMLAATLLVLSAGVAGWLLNTPFLAWVNGGVAWKAFWT